MSKIQMIYESSLLDSDAQVIIQQCNCTSKNLEGLYKEISEKFPYSDVYSGQVKTFTPGTIKLKGDKKKKERFVCTFFSQKTPGKPKDGDSSFEREEWFKKCLSKLSSVKNLKSVAFPYNIGCGLAKGEWNNYFQMIETWSNENPNIKVSIISKKESPNKEKTGQNESKKLLENINIEETKKTLSFSLKDCSLQKLGLFNDFQKARFLDHLLFEIKQNKIPSFDEDVVIKNIMSQKDEKNFEYWAWNHLQELNIPFIDFSYFEQKFSNIELIKGEKHEEMNVYSPGEKLEKDKYEEVKNKVDEEEVEDCNEEVEKEKDEENEIYEEEVEKKEGEDGEEEEEEEYEEGEDGEEEVEEEEEEEYEKGEDDEEEEYEDGEEDGEEEDGEEEEYEDGEEEVEEEEYEEGEDGEEEEYEDDEEEVEEEEYEEGEDGEEEEYEDGEEEVEEEEYEEGEDGEEEEYEEVEIDDEEEEYEDSEEEEYEEEYEEVEIDGEEEEYEEVEEEEYEDSEEEEYEDSDEEK